MRWLVLCVVWFSIFTVTLQASERSPWLKGHRLSEGHVRPAIVVHGWSEPPGTIIVDTAGRRLFLLLSPDKALRYAVAVGRDGYGWRGIATIARRVEWPEWIPPREMTARAAASHRFLPYSIDGGRLNPLGARALYLYQGKHDTLIRIHGTNDPKSIGRAVSSGCIRMRNEDIIDLYRRVAVGTRVVVR
jgi:lipoprotein-anchoring transpeptidase ErfK/SrfK